MTQHFDIYGLRIEVSSSCAQITEEVRRDFAYFSVVPHAPAAVSVELHEIVPPYNDLPALPASFFTPRNVCYKNGHVSYIDYFGRALVVFDRAAGRCRAYSTDRHLLHEIAYLFVLSTAGQHFDRQGLHRIHALGVNHAGRAYLLLLPSGGGKSTMALKMLRQPDFTLLSEDTPLIDRHGRVLPFPLRLGVKVGQQVDIPAEHLRTVPRMEFDPKTLIDIEYFKDKMSGAAEPGAIIVGERNLGSASEIVPLAKRQAFKALVKYMIVGLGVYQGLEFLLERGLRDSFGQTGVAASRLRNATRLLARAPAYRFVLGRNTEKNSETLLDFVRRST